MKSLYYFLTIIVLNFNYCAAQNHDNVNKLPTVMIAILIRNKAHTLPYFFSYLENLNYPKDRLAIWIRSDHNKDNSVDFTQLWLNKTKSLYNYVDFEYSNDPINYQNETTIYDWLPERFSNLIKLKEEALEKAKQLWADYIFYLDADVFLTNSNTLNYLTSLNVPIVSPMLQSEALYSNFWCGMTESYYYQRTDEYKEIYNYVKIGNFEVPMVHSSVLINLNYIHSNMLTFDREKLIQNQKLLLEISKFESNSIKIYDGPLDDIIIFAISARSSNIPLYINNEYSYGYIMVPLESHDPPHRDFLQLVNLKVNIINDLNKNISVNEEFRKFVFYPEKHKILLDHIYMINLERRKERRFKMELSFKEIGLDVEHFPAVDGRNLNLTILQKMGIKFLPEFKDPYHDRQMTMGEVGCFLSHYYIWKKMVKNNQSKVLILEDDIRFEPYFYEKAINVLNQARTIKDWDLIYFGRKRLEDQDEPWVFGTENLVHVGYSYWTIGYVLTLNGAKKLLNSKPLEKILPVDEYLPIMFNRHPNKTWSQAFKTRNLNAYSAAPLLLYPTHYTGDDGYISDTEDSQITPKILNEDNAQLKSDKEKKCAQDLNFLGNRHSLDENLLKTDFTKIIGKHDPSEL